MSLVEIEDRTTVPVPLRLIATARMETSLPFCLFTVIDSISYGKSLHFMIFQFVSHLNCAVIDMRERALEIHPQQAISRDNVSLSLDGVVFVRVVDPELCAYGARRPFFAVRQHAQSVMRAAIGRRTMEDAFHDRAGLNADIKEEIADSAAAWGLEVMRYEVLNIEADATVARAMDLQATAERKRREEIITAEATKRREILEAEGRAQAVERQAEAERQAAILRAQGRAESVRLAAHAERERRVQIALGEAEALAAVGKGLVQENGVAAAHVKLAEDYMRMMGEVGSRSNTMFFSGGSTGGLGSLEEMAAKVAAVFQQSQGTVPAVKEDPSQRIEALDMSSAERYGHVNHVEDEEEDFLSNKYASSSKRPAPAVAGKSSVSARDALRNLEASGAGKGLLDDARFGLKR